jgi:serine/threonine-protein kinase
VWLARDGSEKVALKILLKTKPIAYARFRDEIHVMRDSVGVQGILPIIDCELPEKLETARAWYAMPVATPIVVHLASATARDKVAAVASIAETLAVLHARGIRHRDIKPTNLLAKDGCYYLGDFGLVDYPKKKDLTGRREELGPRWTMAPEVRRFGRDADPLSADVYSLAKTLWILLRGEAKGFEGQYIPGGILSIRPSVGQLYITSLESLLVEATDHDPKKRPIMARFAEGLRRWIHIATSFPEHNRLEWEETQRRLFPLVLPERTVWTSINEIVDVLNVLGETSNLNHLLFPSGGGLDLKRAAQSARENGCIEIDTNGIITIVKPLRLLFESFGAKPEWNYFRLEADRLVPCGVYPGLDEKRGHEEVTDVGGKLYAPRACLDANEYRGKRLPKGSRGVMRYFGGAFVIFQKTSIYNSTPQTYDGRHNKMTSDEFREYIARIIGRLAKRS